MEKENKAINNCYSNMKFINYLSLISFLLTSQQCSANSIDEDGKRVILKPRYHKVFDGKRSERRIYDDSEDNGYNDYDIDNGDAETYDWIDPAEQLRMLSAGFEHNCVVLSLRENRKDYVKCWGSNDSGQLGLGDKLPRGDKNNEMGDDLPFVKIGRLYINEIAPGGFHTCVSFPDCQAKCFGDNRYGQLALGDTKNRGDEPSEMGDNLPLIYFGKNRYINGMATGLFHTCFLFSENSHVACFGNNRYGQLGVGDMINRGGSPDHLGPNILFADITFEGEQLRDLSTYIYSGSTANHTCYLNGHTGSVKCWGSNTKGQLGYGDTKNRGDEPDEMGSNLPIIKLQASERVSTIYVGGANTCVFSSDNEYGLDMLAYCFGNNRYGQLGLGHTKNIGDEPNEMGDNLKPMNLGHDGYIRHMGIGSSHICAVLEDYTMKCYGQNSYGQLGQGDKISRGGSTTSVGDRVSKLNFGTSGNKPRYASAGDSHTCVLFAKNKFPYAIKCFGNGSKGTLGYGDTKNRGDEKNEMGDKLPFVSFKDIEPSKSPSHAPTFKPINQPTKFPTQPTTTNFPTRFPTTLSPTKSPSSAPTQPTKKPSKKKKNGL